MHYNLYLYLYIYTVDDGHFIFARLYCIQCNAEDFSGSRAFPLRISSNAIFMLRLHSLYIQRCYIICFI